MKKFNFKDASPVIRNAVIIVESVVLTRGPPASGLADYC